MDWNRIRSDLKQPAPEPAGNVPHRAIGRYTVLREIARGGMAIVYEAFDPQLRRRVALKVVRDDKGGSSLIERLHREAAAAARVKHPNIVSIHEVGHAKTESGEEIHYIAMDFVDGQTMAAVLPSMDRRERLRVLRDVAIAVDFAHQQGVIHRDLKPQNIMLEASTQTSATGPKWQVYLTDFGLARVLEGEDLTKTGTVMGTVHYMAPEQVRGETKMIGPWTDVWALGVVLYQVLTDRKPFEGEAPLEIYAKIVGDDPVPPCRINRTVHPDLETICLKALEKDPERRYASAGAFAEELRRNRDGEPIEARPLSAVSRAWRKVVKHRGVVLPLVAVVLAASVAVGWVLVDAARKGRASAFVQEGLLELNAGDDLDAMAHFTLAIELNPGLSAAYVHRARAREHRGDLKGAIEDCTTVIRLEPDNSAAYFNRGKTFMALGDEVRALEDLSTAIQLKKTNAMAWSNRAILRWNRKEGDLALADADQALALDGQDYRALLVRGTILINRGQVERGREDWEKALRISPPDWTDREYLRKQLERMGPRPDDGRKEY